MRRDTSRPHYLFLLSHGGTPTLAHLQAYDMLLLWTDSAFQDPVAVGDVLADFIDSGGGLVIATFAFSRGVDNRWWVGGRLLDEEYRPFGISDRRASASGTLNLAGASLDHPIFDGRIEVRDDVGEGVFSDIKKMVLVK